MPPFSRQVSPDPTQASKSRDVCSVEMLRDGPRGYLVTGGNVPSGKRTVSLVVSSSEPNHVMSTPATHPLPLPPPTPPAITKYYHRGHTRARTRAHTHTRTHTHTHTCKQTNKHKQANSCSKQANRTPTHVRYNTSSGHTVCFMLTTIGGIRCTSVYDPVDAVKLPTGITSFAATSSHRDRRVSDELTWSWHAVWCSTEQ
jgi:hypothetical protein